MRGGGVSSEGIGKHSEDEKHKGEHDDDDIGYMGEVNGELYPSVRLEPVRQ